MKKNEIPKECTWICDLCLKQMRAFALKPECPSEGVTSSVCPNMEHLCFSIKSKEKQLETFKKYLPALKRKYTRDEVFKLYDECISEGKRSKEEFVNFLILGGIEVTD